MAITRIETQLNFEDASNVNGFIATLASTVFAMTFGATVTSVSFVQTQHASAAGNPWTIRAQRGFTGFVGGNLTIGGGDGGTSGTNLAGNTIVELGTVVANVSAELQFNMGSGGTFAKLSRTASGARFESTALAVNIVGAAGINLTSSTSDVVVRATGGALYLDSITSSVYNWRGAAGVQTRTDTLVPTGAHTYVTVVGATSVAWSQAARTTDAACAGFTITTQAPFASATGTNRTPGTLTLAVPAAAAGGTAGKISFAPGGTERGYWDGGGQLHVGADADTTGINLRLNGASQTTVGAAGGATALPGTPTGYVKVNIKGTDFVIPYYAAA